MPLKILLACSWSLRLDGVDGKSPAPSRRADEITRRSPGCCVCGSEWRKLLLIAATKAAVGRGIKAGQLVGQLATHVGGRGGGKPDLAQAGGTDVNGIDAALAAAADQLRAVLEASV